MPLDLTIVTNEILKFTRLLSWYSLANYLLEHHEGASNVTKKTESQTSQTKDIVRDDLPSHEEIAALAYIYWEARSYRVGSPEEDWLRAEQEISDRQSGERIEH
jgi:hypothetical protein